MSPPRRFCPRKAGLSVVNDMTGEDLLARCGRNGCGYCGPWKADQNQSVASHQALAQPDRSLVGAELRPVGLSRLVEKGED
jgi:hypothetical protein